MFALWYIYLGLEEYRRVQGLQWNLPNFQRVAPKQKQSSPQPSSNETKNGKQTTPKASPPSTPTKPNPPSLAIDKSTPPKVTPSPPRPAAPANTPTTPKPPPPPVQPPKPSPQQPIPRNRSIFEPDPQLSPESRIFQSTKINDDPPSKISPIMLDSPQPPKPPSSNFPSPSKFSAAPDFQPLTKTPPKQEFENFGRQSSKQKLNENIDERIASKTEKIIAPVNPSVGIEVESTDNTKLDQNNPDSVADINEQAENIDVGVGGQSEQLSVSVNPSVENNKIQEQNTDLMQNINEKSDNIVEEIVNSPENEHYPKSVHIDVEDSNMVIEEEGATANENLAIDASSEKLSKTPEVSFGNSEELENESEDMQADEMVTVTYFDSNSGHDGSIIVGNQDMEDNARFVDSASETFSRMSIKSMPSADSILHGSDELMTAGKRVCKKASWPRRVSISDDPPAVYLTEATRSADQLSSDEQIPFDVKMRRELEMTAAVLREDWMRKKQMSSESKSLSDEEMATVSAGENDAAAEDLESADNELSDTCQAN